MSRLLIYGIIALAVLAAITATIAGIYHKGYSAGEAEIRSQWEAADRKAQDAATALRQQRELEARQAATALQQAESTARSATDRWNQARKESRNAAIPLAVCPGSPQPNATALSGPSQPLVLRLTYSLLRQWDAAWTGADGEPIFRDPGGAAAPEPSAASAVTLDDALDNHAENARRCSENARQLDRLTGLILQLQAR